MIAPRPPQSVVQLTEITQRLKESATLKINQRALALREAGHDLVHFGFGQAPFPIPPSVVSALQENAHHKDYLPTRGLFELREQIAQYYDDQFDYPFDPELICIGPGSKELIYQALLCLQGEVLVPAPSWVSYGPQVSLTGREMVPIFTQELNHYKLTAEELREACISRPRGQKVLIINSPNNPTGAVYHDEEISHLVEVCRAYQVIVISDEIYAEIDFTGQRKKGFFTLYPEGTIVTGGLSKAHAAGGYRLGFLATSAPLRPLIDALCSVISETFSAVSAPIQRAAIAAYQSNDEIRRFIEDTRAIHQLCGQYLAKRLNDLGITTPDPRGAFYLMPNFEIYRGPLLKRGVSTSEELCALLLDEYYIALLPGSDFYLSPSELKVRLATVDYDGEATLIAYRALTRSYSLDLSDEPLIDRFIQDHCPQLSKAIIRLNRFATEMSQ